MRAFCTVIDRADRVSRGIRGLYAVHATVPFIPQRHAAEDTGTAGGFGEETGLIRVVFFLDPVTRDPLFVRELLAGIRAFHCGIDAAGASSEPHEHNRENKAPHRILHLSISMPWSGST